MLRKILLLCPALAFALPFIAANPTMARPLTAEATPANWGDRDDGDDLQLAVCVQTQIFVQTGDNHRAYECDTLTGPTCLASCAGETGERAATCRSQCDGDGAMFCSPSLKSRWGGLGGWHDDDDDDDFQGIGDHDDDDDDHDFDDDQTIFIDTETCLELALDEV
jgi:hypothetical protein